MKPDSTLHHSLQRNATGGRGIHGLPSLTPNFSTMRPHATPLSERLRRFAVLAVLLAGPALASAADPWLVAGRQGLVQVVIVPLTVAADKGAYEQQIRRLCDPERTCFINFYTNSTRAVAEVPVPEAIAGEATATYRRSSKNGVQVFRWSCRMKVPGDECF